LEAEMSADDAKAVKDAAAAFYAALDALFIGDATPMREVWSHADDVTYMGPDGGFDVGGMKSRLCGTSKQP
jgi:hypothetical protein